MPELPEVEITRRGLAPHLLQQRIESVQIRQAQLRWPIPAELKQLLPGALIRQVLRRAKYLLLQCESVQGASGWLLLHLGMSGSLRILPQHTPVEKHDHFDLVLQNKQLMRLRDPRRFGAILWLEGEPSDSLLLNKAGPEPIALADCLPSSGHFDANYLFEQTRRRNSSIKRCLMDNQIVVGIGNIYANEALFKSRIHPATPAQLLNEQQCQVLVEQIQLTLQQALQQGGSTLRDFVQADGKPGYFQQSYFVYARQQQACLVCQTPIRQFKQEQRSSFFCPQCQAEPKS